MHGRTTKRSASGKLPLSHKNEGKREGKREEGGAENRGGGGSLLPDAEEQSDGTGE